MFEINRRSCWWKLFIQNSCVRHKPQKSFEISWWIHVFQALSCVLSADILFFYFSSTSFSLSLASTDFLFLRKWIAVATQTFPCPNAFICLYQSRWIHLNRIILAYFYCVIHSVLFDNIRSESRKSYSLFRNALCTPPCANSKRTII